MVFAYLSAIRLIDRSDIGAIDFGVSDEWHLSFAKVFGHFKFNVFSRPREAVVVLGPAFGHARLEAVGAIGDAVLGDGPQHLLIEHV